MRILWPSREAGIATAVVSLNVNKEQKWWANSFRWLVTSPSGRNHACPNRRGWESRYGFRRELRLACLEFVVVGLPLQEPGGVLGDGGEPAGSCYCRVFQVDQSNGEDDQRREGSPQRRLGMKGGLWSKVPPETASTEPFSPDAWISEE